MDAVVLRRPKGPCGVDPGRTHGNLSSAAPPNAPPSTPARGRRDAAAPVRSRARRPAGIGKSALVQYAIDSASGFRVLRVAGVESEMAFGYAGVHQLVLPLLDVRRRPPRTPTSRARRALLGTVQHDALDPFLVGLAVLSLVAEAAHAQPVLVVVDDAQWLDDESATALSFVGRRLRAERVAMLVAVRETPEPASASKASAGSTSAGLPDAGGRRPPVRRRRRPR